MPSGLLHDESVIFYHPLDDFTEYTKGLDWSSYDGNSSFVPGILTSGIQLDSGKTFDRIVYPDGTYDSLASASGFTTTMWVSGFLTSDIIQRLVYVGTSDNTGAPNDKNAALLYKIGTPTGFNTAARIDGTFGSQAWSPPPSNDTDWHFFAIDIRYEIGGWRHRVSIDGADWLDLGIDAHGGKLTSAVDGVIIRIDDSSTATIVVDEVVLWGDNDLFTPQELSNLYELYNTYNTTMDQYTSTFAISVSGEIGLFVNGYESSSGNISLYMPAQYETGSIDLFLASSPPTSGSVDNFIYGHLIVSDDEDQYIKGHESVSGEIDFYIDAILGSSFPMYIQGPLPSSGYLDNIITGHIFLSGGLSLFVDSYVATSAFVCVNDNIEYGVVDFFIHGVPSGSSPTTSYTNNSVGLFINNYGDNATLTFNRSSFVRVDDPIPTTSSGVWMSFVRCGNTADDTINLYINGHASGEPPNGISITNSFSTFIEGLSINSGDQGLLEDGFYFISLQTDSFTRVHDGVSNGFDLYMSGVIPVTPPSAVLDMFMFGITGTQSGVSDYYISGKAIVYNNTDLFVFGIIGLPSGSIPLYLVATTTGVLSTSKDVYIHGY